MGNLTCSLMLFAQQSVSQVKPGAEEAPLLSPWWVGLIVVSILGAPFLAGNLIARAIKMKELATKIGVMILVSVLGLAPFVSQYAIGALEQSQYEKELAAWKEKQVPRDTFEAEGATGISELKNKVSGVQVRWESQKKDTDDK